MITSRKPLILIVDDTPSNIHVLVESLNDEYNIKIAKSGESALEIARSMEQQPDLILLDVMMPEMDGYEVCKKLKETDESKDIPVIFLTAKDGAGDEEYGFSLGAMDYILKPFKIPIVKARIRTHLLLKFQRNELMRQNIELKQALDQIKVLRGCLPICCTCKKIRDDKGYWNQVEKYISEHSEAVFTHGMCPECLNTLYPDCQDDIP